MESMSISLQFQAKRSYFKELLKVDVSLSELNALSECHPLSEAPARLADRRNLEGNLSRRHVLSASLAHSASHLSPSRLNASLARSENSLTRAKRENDAKRDVEVSEPFLSLEWQKRKGGWNTERSIVVRAWGVKYTEAKKPGFDLLGRFVSFWVIVRFLEVEETSPLLCKQAIYPNSSSSL